MTNQKPFVFNHEAIHEYDGEIDWKFQRDHQAILGSQFGIPRLSRRKDDVECIIRALSIGKEFSIRPADNHLKD